ncbi:MAG TPA: tail fiber protein [Candidatus Acidoferrales bacterium]|nr:tail fiber protein [Candidatus Acidoferrales bacterium]
MADPYLGEIRMFAGNFAPVNWATCDGQLLPISQNTALFSLLGTNFGGNGTSIFQLPNLKGSAPLCAGAGIGLTERFVGETGGVESVTIDSATMPAHNHAVLGVGGGGDKTTPIGNTWAEILHGRTAENLYTDDTASLVQLGKSGTQIVSSVGGSLPHENRQPYLAVTFIICLSGIFPQRP